MTTWICAACGVQHEDTERPPERCDICTDDRQYVPAGGQVWAAPAELATAHAPSLVEVEPDLHELGVDPRFAIGQHTLLLRTPEGNLLWEPSGALPPGLVEQVRDLGGVAAVASSHPHLVGASAAWARTFDAPFWFNADDRRWLRDGDDRVRWWTDRAEVLPGVTLVQAGGHFPGSCVALWAGGADGRGELLTGDTVMVNPDHATVSFMRSYPNYVPLPPRLVRGVVAALEPLRYDRLRSGFGVVLDGADLAAAGLEGGAHAAVVRSAERYVGWLSDEIRDPDERG